MAVRKVIPGFGPRNEFGNLFIYSGLLLALLCGVALPVVIRAIQRTQHRVIPPTTTPSSAVASDAAADDP